MCTCLRLGTCVLEEHIVFNVSTKRWGEPASFDSVCGFSASEGKEDILFCALNCVQDFAFSLRCALHRPFSFRLTCCPASVLRKSVLY